MTDLDPEVESKMIDNIILNLKIISEIKKGDKLSVSDEIVSIDSPGIFQGIKRWYSNNNRKFTINKIESIIEDCIKLTKSKIDIIKESGDDREKRYFEEEVSHFFQRIFFELVNSKRGIDNLKLTYTDDISITSRIELILSKIITHTREIESILKIKLD